MHQSNITALSDSLISMGFPTSVETQLLCHVCFDPLHFEISHSTIIGGDQGIFSVRVERDEHGIYFLKYYTACLRKRVEVPSELVELDQRMAAVDWAAVIQGRQMPGKVELSVLKVITEVLRQLQQAGLLADVLRYKYWQGTALEPLILQLSQHRSTWEITERFYFFNDMDMIRFQDAIRFLNSRWMERQMLSKKKLAERSSETEAADGGRSLLIKKKPRASGRKNLLKK